MLFMSLFKVSTPRVSARPKEWITSALAKRALGSHTLWASCTCFVTEPSLCKLEPRFPKPPLCALSLSNLGESFFPHSHWPVRLSVSLDQAFPGDPMILMLLLGFLQAFVC